MSENRKALYTAITFGATAGLLALPYFIFGDWRKRTESAYKAVDAQRLTGLLEVGGSLTFEPGKSTIYTTIQIQDNDQTKIKAYMSKYKGGIRQRGESLVWQTNGQDAQKILYSIAPLTIRHSDRLLRYFHLTRNLPKTPEAISEAVTLLKEIQPSYPGASLIYDELVQMDAFVAGVFDSRGTIFTSDKRLKVDISSRNSALLYSLQNRFHGDVTLRVKAGEAGSIAGTDFTTKSDIYTFSLEYALARDFLKVVRKNSFSSRIP